jgi:CHAT domain-containing protein
MGEQAAAIEKEIQEILKQYQEVEGQIRQVSPGYAALTQPQALSAKEVQQQLLDSDTLLLEYALGEERSYVFAVTHDSIAAFPLPKRTEIEAPARELYLLLSSRTPGEETRKQKPVRAPAEYKLALAKLSQMVLGPVADQLNRKRVLVVSDGALQYIPFAILLTPENPSVSLLMEHEVVNLPSASVLAVLRQQLSGRKAAPKAVAVLADPVFDIHDDRLRLATKNDKSSPPDSAQASGQSGLYQSAREVDPARNGTFPRLPYSRREADAIFSIAKQGNVTESLDFNASKDTAMSPHLRDYRIVHFATHGLLNNEHPELSGLVFSLVDRQGKIQDGFLRLLDIYNLDLNADLVVLSACQTALGKLIAEEGLVGLTRGFMYAGAPRVMASLWKVDDEATAELMKKLYEGMLKHSLTPAQALRSAQVWMSQQKRWKHPYYWAGFVLQGEWK